MVDSSLLLHFVRTILQAVHFLVAGNILCTMDNSSPAELREHVRSNIVVQ